MSYEAFQKKCDNHEKTLTIAKSNHGKVFGGYTDQKWNYTNNYKTSRDSWLFSIDEKLKFPIMEDGISNAIYACAGYGPTFGSGHDLYIHFSSNYKEESSSHSELGHSYQMNFNSKSAKRVKGDETENQTILAGSYQFNVEELEIYAVENRNNNFDSEIINLKRDLNLIKSWLGRGKNHALELIYRGSRDGFTSENFHEACDDKGPTLVVCKSKYTERIFGGFTSKNWSTKEVYVEDQDAFLFSLTNSTKHSVIGKEKAIYCSEACGPAFGAGSDLYICSESNIVESSTSTLGVSYQVSESVEQKESYLAGDFSFFIDEIEVFTVKSN